MRSRSAHGYADVRSFRRGEQVDVQALSCVSFEMAGILGPPSS
jgi:hypothetical protein